MRTHHTCLTALLFAAATPAQAGPETCPSVLPPSDEIPVDYLQTQPDCVINWVENNRLQTLVWQQYQDDFAAPILTKSVDGSLVMVSREPPSLMDIDADGWSDLAHFTPIGMVNGDYDIFRYNAETSDYTHLRGMNGHTFVREHDGYYVAAGRNGGGATNFQFYKIEDDALAFQFELEVNAGVLPRKPQCGFSTINPADVDASHAYVDARDAANLGQIDLQMIQYYCNNYTHPDEPSRGVDLWDIAQTAQIVPDGTVFHCTLDGGTHNVTITKDTSSYTYNYGPITGTTELTLTRSANDVKILPDNGAGPSRFGDITFQNGDYAYTAFYSMERFDANNQPLQASLENDTFTRGLMVTKADDIANPVFQKDCMLDTSYDAIWALNP